MQRAALLTVLTLAAFAATYALVKHRQQSATDAPASPPGIAPEGMVWIPGGEFSMGTNDEMGWAEEKPAHRVRLDGFWMDAKEVSNDQFAAFAAATDYVTTAERPPSLADVMSQVPPGTPPPDPASLVPGSLVFTAPAGPVDLGNFSGWWRWTPGASWRHPEGPASDLEGRGNHPVVQVSWDDAVAYARWAGKHLPTEAQWERAARGGLVAQTYVWGQEPPSEDHVCANIWQGEFPHRNTLADGYAGTAPVGSFAPNGYGLYDMAGNVWEWCSDWYDRNAYQERARRSLTFNPQGPDHTIDPLRPYEPQRVQRGGSFLCNDSYCTRYRPSARHGGAPDTGMSHLGFRCVMSEAARREQETGSGRIDQEESR